MRFKRLFAAALIFACVVSLPLAPVGCGSPTAKTTQIAGTTTATVDAVMQSWGEWVRAGKATGEDRGKVRDAYRKYQVAMKLAENAAVASLSSPTNQPVYVTALNTAAQASGDLIALIESFTSKK